MAVVYHLRAEIPTEVGQLGDGRWRAECAGLGLYAYGASPDEASHGIIEQINGLTQFFGDNDSIQGLQARFTNAGIDLAIREEEIPEPPAQGRILPLMLAFGKVLQHA